MKNMTNYIINEINTCVASANARNKESQIWKKPLISFLKSDNSQIINLKGIVSIDHLLPNEILSDAKSIICFFIPFTEKIVKSNIGNKRASKEWTIAYIETNNLIKEINEIIEKLMIKNGYKAGKIPATNNFNKETLVSNWSHRHIAFLSGLGSFGLNNMLITENGCCGRIGSIVTNYDIDFENKISDEKCLYKINGSCRICIDRCVNNAFHSLNFDRNRCHQMCLENAEYYKDFGYADVCGKCLVGLPCSSTDPSKKLKGISSI